MKEVELFIKSLNSEKTKQSYRIWIESFLEYYKIENVEKLKEIETADVFDWVDHLRNKGNLDNSIKPKCQAVNSFYIFLMENTKYNINSNPVYYVLKKLKPQKNPSKRTFLTISEQKRFLRECTTKREKAMFTLFLNNGLRVSELIGLQLEDYCKTELNGRTVYYLNIKRKGSKIQKMILNDGTSKYLNDYIKNSRKQSLYNNIFISNSGKPMTTVCIDRTVKKIARKAKIDKNISAHSLRRSIATSLHEQGVDINGIKNVLGHSSISTTQIYIQNFEKEANNIFTNYSVLNMN